MQGGVIPAIPPPATPMASHRHARSLLSGRATTTPVTAAQLPLRQQPESRVFNSASRNADECRKMPGTVIPAGF